MNVKITRQDYTDWGVPIHYEGQCQAGTCRAIWNGDDEREVIEWFATEHLCHSKGK